MSARNPNLLLLHCEHNLNLILVWWVGKSKVVSFHRYGKLSFKKIRLLSFLLSFLFFALFCQMKAGRLLKLSFWMSKHQSLETYASEVKGTKRSSNLYSMDNETLLKVISYSRKFYLPCWPQNPCGPGRFDLNQCTLSREESQRRRKCFLGF